MAFSAGLNQKKALGEFLHAQEDTYAHSDSEGDRSFEYFGDLYGLTDNGGIYGHFFHGHNPDQTWRDRAKALKMARKVFQDLKTISASVDRTYPRPGAALSDPDTVTTDAVWDGMKGDLETFVSFPPNVVRTFGFVETVTYGGSNDKIKLLDSSFTVDPAYKTLMPTATGYKAGTYLQTKARSIGTSIGDAFNSVLVW